MACVLLAILFWAQYIEVPLLTCAKFLQLLRRVRHRQGELDGPRISCSYPAPGQKATEDIGSRETLVVHVRQSVMIKKGARGAGTT